MNISVGLSDIYPGFYEKVWMPFKDSICSIYFAAPRSYEINNARGIHINSETFNDVLRMKSEKPDLDCNLLLNSSCIGNRLKKEEELKIEQAITNLFDAGYITSVSVSNSWYLNQVLKWKEKYKANLEVHISVIWDIKTIDELNNIFWKFGDNCVQCVNISRTKVHDIEFLKKFKKTFPNIKTKVIVNEWCMHHCPDQHFHANYLSHTAEYSKSEKICVSESLSEIQFCNYNIDNYWRFLCGKGIPPDCIDYYNDIISFIKIGSRKKHPDTIAELCRAYINRSTKDLYFLITTSHGGFCLITDEDKRNVLSFKNKYLTKEWFEKRINCKDECYKCHFCKDYLKKIN